MAYVLYRDEPVDQSVRAIVREQVRDAIDRCRRVPRVDLHDDVHEVRKALKKVRATLSLVRGTLPHRRKRALAYRDIGRRLSDLRDAAAVVESMDSLAETLDAEVGAERREMVRDWLVKHRDGLGALAEPVLAKVGEELQSELADVDDYRLSAEGFDAIAGGLARAYRRGKHRAYEARPGLGAAGFHEWRKRAKEHRYHLELLVGVGPLVEHAHELTDLLGRAQDITVLGEVADAAPGFEVMRPVLDATRIELQTAACDVGKLVYGRNVARLQAAVLQAWRSSVDD